MNLLDVLGSSIGDELSRESGNLVRNLGTIGWEGAKLTGQGVRVTAETLAPLVKEGVSVATPVIKSGIDTAVDTAVPIIKSGIDTAVDTAVPIIRSGIDSAVETATPVVRETADKVVDMVSPAAKATSDRALEAIQPYLDEGRRVPDELLRQAREAAGNERVTAFIDASRTTRSGFARSLRGIAGLIETESDKVGLDGPPPSSIVVPPKLNPFQTALEAQEKQVSTAVEAKAQAAMAPLYRFQEDLRVRAIQFAVLCGAGGVTLVVVRQFLAPVERLAQQVLLGVVGSCFLYGAVTYGPKAVKIYQILNDETTAIEAAVSFLHVIP